MIYVVTVGKQLNKNATVGLEHQPKQPDYILTSI